MKKLIPFLLILSFTIKAQDVTIGRQTWTGKNLDLESYRNGDAIPQVQDKKAWSNLKTGAWCYYENYTANGTTYGKLYNWYAVIDPRGLAPEGYHIPTDEEWTILSENLGDEAGTKMKSRSGWSSYSSLGSYEKTCPNCSKWSEGYRDKFFCHTCNGNRSVTAYEPKKTHSGNGTNTSGFNGLPGGFRYPNGNFLNVGWTGYWWSSSEDNSNFAWDRNLNNDNGSMIRPRISVAFKQDGFSVRCIKD